MIKDLQGQLHDFRKEIDSNIKKAGSFKIVNRDEDSPDERSKCQREMALAHTKLQEAKMWVGKCLEAGYFTEEDWDTRISAYTTAELGNMLPDMIRIKKQYRILTLLKKESVNEKTRRYEMLYGYYYFDVINGKCCKDQLPEVPKYDINESNARALLLIHLKENNLI